MSDSNLWRTTQTVWWHEGSNTESILKDLCEQCSTILVVFDVHAYAASGVESLIEHILGESDVYAFPVHSALPTFTLLRRALCEHPLVDADLVIAVGGGTTIDLAKLITYYGGGGKVDTFEELAENPLEIPLLVIPTTSGSGSEATPFAVLYVDGVKHSIFHPSILPDYAYLYPALTRTLSATQRAATGLDALAQGIESYWAVGATFESQQIAKVAIQESWGHLVKYVKDPDESSRIAMVMAAHMAGRAIAATTTTVCHALSYTMTSEYDVPHGIAVALTLGPALIYNSQVTDEDVVDSRGAGYVRSSVDAIVTLLGFNSPEEACLGIMSLMDEILEGHDPGHFGIESESDLLHIASTVNPERLKNNPRKVTADALVELLSNYLLSAD